MSGEQAQPADDEHEYVELLLDVKDGEVVSCEYFGEGRQAVPLTKPILLKQVEGDVWPRGYARLERLIQRAFRKLVQQTPGA